MGDPNVLKKLPDDQPIESVVELQLEELRDGMREINITLTHILQTLQEIREESSRTI